MNQTNLKILTARVRGLGKELLAIANQLDAQAPHLAVQLPRDLFSDLDEPQTVLFEGITTTHKDADGTLRSETKAVMPTYNELPTIPAEQLLPKTRKTWKRVGCKMQDTAIVAAEKVGRRSGWCQRSDIERSLHRRNPGRTREDVREAVNRVAARMQITCVKSRSYRYYPKSQRNAIVDAACEELERI